MAASKRQRVFWLYFIGMHTALVLAVILMAHKTAQLSRQVRERLDQDFSRVLAKQEIPISIPDKYRKMVVRIKAPGGSGSGVFISQDTIMTNMHVVSSCSTPQAWVDLPDGDSVVVSIVAKDEARDLAILKLPPGKTSAVWAEIGTPLMEWGNPIIVVGCPGGAPPLPCRGTYICKTQEGRIMLNVLAYYGNSGGPVLDEATGTLIGIMCIMDSRGGKEVPFLFQCIPTEWINQFLSEQRGR
jgi:S1-C subfamily serine protease